MRKPRGVHNRRHPLGSLAQLCGIAEIALEILHPFNLRGRSPMQSPDSPTRFAREGDDLRSKEPGGAGYEQMLQ